MSLLKKNKRNSLTPANSNLETQNALLAAQRKIEEGLSKETASTGTPIENLYGAPKFMAQLSNIGGGSKETGGGGIKEGFNTIATYVDANAKVQAQNQSLSTQKKMNALNKK